MTNVKINSMTLYAALLAFLMLSMPAHADDMPACDVRKIEYLTQKQAIIQYFIDNSFYQKFVDDEVQSNHESANALYDDLAKKGTLTSVPTAVAPACTTTLQSKILALYDEMFGTEHMVQLRDAAPLAQEHDAVIANEKQLPTDLVELYQAFKSKHAALLADMRGEITRAYRTKACAQIRIAEGPKEVIKVSDMRYRTNSKTITVYYPCKLP